MAIVVVLCAVGCSKSKPNPTAGGATSDSGPAADLPIMDDKLAKAVKPVAAASTGAARAQDEGPPPAGVFGPGEADQKHAREAPVKIVLVRQGSKPQVMLKPRFDTKLPEQFEVMVAKRIGGNQGLLAFDYTLAFELDKGEDKDKRKTKGKATGKDKKDKDPFAASKLPRLVTTVKKVVISSQAKQIANVKELNAEAAKLEKSRIISLIAPDGSCPQQRLELPKKKDIGALKVFLEGMVDVLGVWRVPAPPKPVGAGAQWMAEDRVITGGLEVIRYRVFEVKEIAGQQVTLTVSLKQYSVGGLVSFTGAPPGMTLEAKKFESSGKGELTLTAGSLVPTAGQLNSSVGMEMTAAERPGQTVMMQTETIAKVLDEVDRLTP